MHLRHVTVDTGVDPLFSCQSLVRDHDAICRLLLYTREHRISISIVVNLLSSLHSQHGSVNSVLISYIKCINEQHSKSSGATHIFNKAPRPHDISGVYVASAQQHEQTLVSQIPMRGNVESIRSKGDPTEM